LAMRFPRASLVTACVTLVALGVSCTGTRTDKASPSAATSTNPATPSAQPVTDYSSFTQALETSGFAIRPGGRTGLPASLLAVPGQHVRIDGKQISVFEYPSEKALDKVRSAISPRGDQIPTAGGGLAIINWDDAPRFYGSGKLLVLYFGDKQNMLDALEHLLGPPLAGG
jgi:hypothetical protein